MSMWKFFVKSKIIKNRTSNCKNKMNKCLCSECRTNKWTLKRNGDCNHLLKYRWFHSHLSRGEAEQLIQNQGSNGSFLVRESESRPGDFVLSVRSDNRVHHITIHYYNNVYDVGDNRRFSNLEKLIKFYKKNPIFSRLSGTTMHLKQPFNVTRIGASGINTQVEQLKTQIGPEPGFWAEFESLQHQQQEFNRFNHLYSRNEAILLENRKKNRYKNILPYDHTRVKLMDVDHNISGSDYINASYIKWYDTYGENNIPSDPSIKSYIATQGCLPSTVADFWSMVWQENCRVIVMIINETEKNKCAKYWAESNVPKDYGTMTVLKLVECPTEQYIIRKFVVKNNKTGCERRVYQYHFVAWPDLGVPSNPEYLIQFLDEINKMQEYLALVLPVNQNHPGAILVHCSAGVGRTGTLIVINMILDQIKKKGLQNKIDIQRTIQMVRSQRFGMVQTYEQYKFIYFAVQHYKAITMKRNKAVQNTINQTHADYAYAQVLDS